jgi:hypothetical protein
MGIAPTYSWPWHQMGVSGQHHTLAMLYLQEMTHGTHWTGGWAGLRSGLDTEARGKVLCLCWRSNPGCPICSQTLYWLSYPSSSVLFQAEKLFFFIFSSSAFSNQGCIMLRYLAKEKPPNLRFRWMLVSYTLTHGMKDPNISYDTTSIAQNSICHVGK